MRAILYILLTLSIITSCKSIDKMVEKGEYEKAFEYAIDKLAGEKNKETKYVKGLEKAYRELNEKDFEKIYTLEKSNRLSKWEEILDIYTRVERREDKISGLLPLISKDGYVADIEEYDFSDKKIEIINNALASYYNEGVKILDLSYKNNNKYSAREAYYMLERTKKFASSYRDVNELMDKAKKLGTLNISIDFKSNLPNNIFADRVIDRLEEIDIHRLDSKWENHFFFDKSKTFDKYVVINFDYLFFDKERELNNNYEFTEIVEDGFENVYDDKGKVVVDSLGKAILVPRKIKVHAWVLEIFREKNSNAKVNVLVYDAVKSNPKANIPVNVYHNFKDSAVKFTGDRRALNHDFRNRIDDHINNFPNDYEVAEMLANNLLASVETVIRDYNF